MQALQINIQKAEISDSDKIQSIGKQTFFETFADSNTEENMHNYLEQVFSIEKITTEINNPFSSFYLASFEDQLIGYLKLNFGNAQTELKDHTSLEIERIYVLKSFYGKGAGQVLFDKALEIAQQQAVDYIWLGVWEKNTRAIAFYSKNGFVPFDTHVFKLGNDEQTDVLMKLKLV